MNQSICSRSVIVSLVAGASLSPAFGQDVPTLTLEPLIVIGDRVSDFSTEPVSATLLDGAELLDSGEATPQGVAARTPNLSTTDSGVRSYGDVFSMRGLTNTPFFSAPSVVLYVDDIPYGDTYSYAQELTAADTVEVFRGPQHTLFGRYSYGGVINVESKRPTGIVEGTIGTTIGSDEAVGYDFGLMGPLAENLYFRLGTSYHSRNGFIRNTLTGETEDTVAHGHGDLTLFWIPGDGWDVSVAFSTDEYNDGAPRLSSLSSEDPFVVRSDFAGEMNRTANSQALRIAYENGEHEFLAVTSRRDWEIDPYAFDLDFTEFPGGGVTIAQDQEILSQEFRLQTIDDPSRTVGYTIGAYAHQIDTGHNGDRFFVDPSSGFTGEQTTVFDQTERALAVFGQAEWKATDLMRLYAGARLDYVETEMTRSKVSNFSAPLPTYDLGGGATAYASTSYAFKPGGFSGFVDTQDLAEYEDEKTWASEVGVRWKGEDERLKFDLTTFYYDIEDYQVERSFSVVDYAVFNAADASAYGVELQASYDLGGGFAVDGSIGYTHIVLDSYTDPLTGTNFDGNTAPYVPEFDASAAISYNCECGAFARFEVIGKGEVYFDDANTEGFKEDAYAIYNASVGYRSDNWEIALYGTNLSDELYYGNKTIDVNAGSVGAPQQLGVRVSLAF
jgi:iron complex outermembrane recepter protein